MPEEPINHARDRIYGGGQPFELNYSPGAGDFRRWLLTDAGRIVKAEEERVNGSPSDD